MTWNTVSIEPGSERALALAAEDLAVMHYTGRSITKGYGRDKTSTYRTGIQTKLGDIEQGQWQALMRDIIRRNGELKLLDALIAWELEHTPWVHTREEAEQRALESVPVLFTGTTNPAAASRPFIQRPIMSSLPTALNCLLPSLVV